MRNDVLDVGVGRRDVPYPHKETQCFVLGETNYAQRLRLKKNYLTQVHCGNSNDFTSQQHAR